VLLSKLINLVITFLTWIVNLFPEADSSTVTMISSFSTTLHNSLVTGSYFVPVNTMLNLMALVITIEGSILSFKIVRWISSNVTLGFLK